MPEHDRLYDKYRLFYEPNDDTPDGHPVKVMANYFVGLDLPSGDRNGAGEIWHPLQEAEGFYFVLRPETDEHARVALAAYAQSCLGKFPRLSDDLFDVLDSMNGGPHDDLH